MQQWKIGAVTVTSVIEYEVPLPPGGFLPGATPEMVAEQDWLRPDFVDEEGQLILRIHALVIESEGKRIIVDTCVGNDKPRTRDLFDRIQGPFMTNFTDAGFRCETVDHVICTHLHIDHIGWNTRIGPDGTWVPTFPNVRLPHRTRRDGALVGRALTGRRPARRLGATRHRRGPRRPRRSGPRGHERSRAPSRRPATRPAT